LSRSRLPPTTSSFRDRITPHGRRPVREAGCSDNDGQQFVTTKRLNMAKKSRGGRMTAAKKRAAKGPGGKGMVKNRPAGRKIMST
jgi:hypothetical protein